MVLTWQVTLTSCPSGHSHLGPCLRWLLKLSPNTPMEALHLGECLCSRHTPCWTASPQIHVEALSPGVAIFGDRACKVVIVVK